ncbi:hypothetical protein CRG98_013437 [Punica granatum]|uniref:Uncharacterized protein n=1 Tax=Punica granatum TaxID=22663 RepID=A0A2I0KCB6_PUNGR|nr:hypothetical protein CRG98_013437 [Punica granatum]
MARTITIADEDDITPNGSHVCDRLHGLGVSTFPWGRVMDTREKELALPVYDPKVRASELPGSRGMGYT